MANIAERFKWQEPLPWWRTASFQRGLPHAMLCLAVLAAIAALVAFYLVVSGAVQQGEMLRLTMAEQARATWQCKTLSGNGASESCLRLLKALARENQLP